MSPPDATFRVVSSPKASDYVVKAEGGIDLGCAPCFQKALLDALVSFPDRLIIDMSEVGFFDMTGVDVLLSTHKRGKAIGTEVVVQAPSPAVREFLRGAGALDALPVRNTPSTRLWSS